MGWEGGRGFARAVPALTVAARAAEPGEVWRVRSATLARVRERCLSRRLSGGTRQRAQPRAFVGRCVCRGACIARHRVEVLEFDVAVCSCD